MTSLTRSRLLLIVFLSLIGGMYYHMLSLTPPIIDDYWFQYRILEKGYTTLPITNWKELIETVYNLPEVRLANILFVVIVNAGGFPLLETLNAVCLIIFIVGLSKLCCGRVSSTSVGTVLLMGLLVLPKPEILFLWHVATLNYLWGGTLLILLLLLLKGSLYEGRALTGWKMTVACILAFLCGFMHEGIGVSMIGGLCLFIAFAWYEKREFHRMTILLIVLFFIIGLLLPLSAPGLWRRVGNASSNRGLSTTVIGYLYHCYPALLLLVLLVLTHFKIIIRQPYTCFLLSAMALPFAAGTNSTGGGVYFYGCLFILILILPYANSWLAGKNKWLSTISLVAPLLILVCHYPTIRQVHHDYTAILQRAQEERIVGYDLFHDTDMWKMITSLPYSTQEPLYWWVGKLHGQRDFYVVLNTELKDKTVYDSFMFDDEDSPSWRRKGKLSVVRLPKGWRFPPYNKIKPYGLSDKEVYSLRPPTTTKGCFRAIMNRWKGRKEMRMAFSFDRGFHYIILPDENGQLGLLHLPMYNEATEEVREFDIHLRE